MRTEVIDFRAFVRNEWRKPTLPERFKRKGYQYISVGSGIFLVLAPQVAHAQSKDDSFNTVHGAAMNLVDWLCVGVIVFAGVSWMFGNRTKAIELLIGCGCGFLLARHAVDIKDWLKTI